MLCLHRQISVPWCLLRIVCGRGHECLTSIANDPFAPNSEMPRTPEVRSGSGLPSFFGTFRGLARIQVSPSPSETAGPHIQWGPAATVEDFLDKQLGLPELPAHDRRSSGR